MTLAAVFEATDYYVQTGDEWCQINIGSPCPDTLRRWLISHCTHPCAWLITAYNPQAQLASDTENHRRDAALKACLAAEGHTHIPASSHARDGTWPVEPGVCITDMDEGLARALALRFGQTALVAIPIDEPVQLVWTDISESDS